MSYTTSVIPLESFASFGALLKYLRVRARLNQTALAIAVGYSTAQISRLEKNQRLPELTMLVALFVPALALDDEPEIVARLLELAAVARSEHVVDRSFTFSHSTRQVIVDGNVVQTEAQASYHYAMPWPLTPLVGRDVAVSAVSERLLRPNIRLLTLLGSPGVGKTRLSLEVARQVQQVFPGGIRFVALAQISDAALLVSAIARTIDVTEIAGEPLLERLKSALRNQEMLLVLDNFEQLLTAASILAELLSAAPKLKLLVTSRAALHLSVEHEWSVPPLAVPDLAHLPSFNELASYPAVAFFTLRAEAVNPEFVLTPSNVVAVAALCVHLDGLPLAIELAAVRSKVLTPQLLLARLVDRFHLLTGGSQDVPPRHRTLRHAIDWSYALLEINEQKLFAWLSVFVGGWTVAAAEALGRDWQLASGSILDLMAGLLDKSLIHQTYIPSGEQRFMILETLGEYGRERLIERDELAMAQHGHTTYFLSLAAAAESKLPGPEHALWLSQLEQEHDNFRTVLARAAEHGDAETLLRLTTVLWKLWDVRGYLHEGREWMEKALSMPEDQPALSAVPPILRAQVLEGAGFLAFHQSDYVAARHLFNASLARYRDLEDKAEVASALNNLGLVAWHMAEYGAAHARFEESLALYREVGHKQGTAWALGNLGIIGYEQGDYKAAQRYYSESLATHRELQNTLGIAQQLNNLGNVAYDQGDFITAHGLYEQSLELKRELGNVLEIPSTLQNLGNTALMQGDAAAASLLLEESLVHNHELGDKQGIAHNLLDLSRVALESGDYVQVREHLRQSLAMFQELNIQLGLIRAFEICADLAATQDLGRHASMLFGAAEALHNALGAPLSPADQHYNERFLNRARSQLDAATFAAAWGAGQAMNMEQLLAFALNKCPEPGDGLLLYGRR